ncbi:MAG: phenylalanine--tRNA ligase subunit alpha [Proteobacteria bacterium]|nr:phenylalanine--tRNA ligase subunit alpha [Pseudomonadota bacterium]
MHEIDAIKKEFISDIADVNNQRDLHELKVKFLGKKCVLQNLMQNISKLPLQERKEFGKNINLTKDFIQRAIEQKKSSILELEMKCKVKEEKIDITLPARNFSRGQSHIIQDAIYEIEEIFSQMNFALVDGPEVETEYYNFDALNIQKDHPARQSHDTFYIGSSDNVESHLLKKGLLLRTHTSSVQIRYMQTNKPPARIISIGKVYRADFDATHTPMFHQVEGLCIEDDINIGHLKYCIEVFLEKFFKRKIEIRMRSSYFPFTEPSFEIDIKRSKQGRESEEWLEILGCGMVANNVLKSMNLNADNNQGFAFGIGIERLVMIRENIIDIRDFF